MIIDNYQWKHFITRPFTLFGTSIWHEWYSSNLMKNLVGMTLENGLYIEYPKGNIRHYRESLKIDRFIKSAQDVALDKNKSISILKKGIEMNKIAKKKLINPTFTNLSEELKFFIEASLYAGNLPYFIGQSKIIDNEIFKLVYELRSVSYYPRLLEEIVIPLAKRELLKNGISNSEIIDVLTLSEILHNNIPINRLDERASHKTFLYKNIGGEEEIEWTNDPQGIIAQIENTNNTLINTIKGQVAFKGYATGKVRKIFENDLKKIQFKTGEILVSPSTNPALLPFMKKSGAIVTDEGGITSHAAIVSRELKKPCIIGTKIATQVLKDGDLVEVNANEGIVKILKKAISS